MVEPTVRVGEADHRDAQILGNVRDMLQAGTRPPANGALVGVCSKAQIVGGLAVYPEAVQHHAERSRPAVRSLPRAAVLLGSERDDQAKSRLVDRRRNGRLGALDLSEARPQRGQAKAPERGDAGQQQAPPAWLRGTYGWSVDLSHGA